MTSETKFDFSDLTDDQLFTLLCEVEDKMMTMAFTHHGTQAYLDIHAKLDALIDEDMRRRGFGN